MHKRLYVVDAARNLTRLLVRTEIPHKRLTLAIFASHRPPGKLLFGEKYQNENFESFVHCVRTFFKSAAINKPPLAACLAVAGPVKDNAVRFTNRLSWSIQGDLLGSELGIKSIRLINDFLAVGYGLLTLDEDNECITLQSAPKQSAAPIACIGAGTGLGECFLTPTADGEYNCFPSEGGHSEYAPRNDLETAMLCYLKDKFAQRHRVSVERVVSGTGLANVYEFLATYKPDQINPHVHSLIEAAGDMKGGVIATNQDNCRLCKLTMEIFTTAYGAEAGVAALKWLPFGGKNDVRKSK
jgi:glucokinase